MDDLYNWKPDAKQAQASSRYLHAAFDAATEEPPQRGIAGDMASGLKRGLFVGTPQMIGGAMKAFAPVDSRVYRSGQELQDSAKAIAGLPDMQRSGTDHGVVGNTLVSGAEGIGQMAPVIAGGLINPVLGAGIAGTMYGGSTYQDTKERMLAQEGLDDVYAATHSADARVGKAKRTGLATGVVQGVGDAVMTYLGGRFLKGAFPSLGKQTAQGVVRGIATPGRDTLTRFGKAWGAEMLGEGVTEAAQDEGQAAIERAAGLKDAPAFGEQALHSAQGGVGMAMLLGPLAGPGHYSMFRDARQVQRALVDPSTDPVVRSAAARVMGNEIAKSDRSAAANFLGHAHDAIGDEEQTGSAPYALNLDDPTLLQPFVRATEPGPSSGDSAQTAPAEPATPPGTILMDSDRGPGTGDQGPGISQQGAVSNGQEMSSRLSPESPQAASTGPLSAALNRGISGISGLVGERRTIRGESTMAVNDGLAPAPIVRTPSELEKAHAWAQGEIASGRGLGLMQGYGTSDAQHDANVLTRYRRAVGGDQGPGTSDQGSGTRDQESPSRLTPDASPIAGNQGPGTGNRENLSPLTPHASPAVAGPRSRVPASPRRQLDPAKDDLVVAMAKLGGLDLHQAKQQWGATVGDDAKEINRHAGRAGGTGIAYAFKSGGLPLDRMREALVGHGYLPEDATINDLAEAVHAAARGSHTYSSHADVETRLDRAEQEWLSTQDLSQALELTDDDLGAIGIDGFTADEQQVIVECYDDVAHALLDLFDELHIESYDDVKKLIMEARNEIRQAIAAYDDAQEVGTTGEETAGKQTAEGSGGGGPAGGDQNPGTGTGDRGPVGSDQGSRTRDQEHPSPLAPHASPVTSNQGAVDSEQPVTSHQSRMFHQSPVTDVSPVTASEDIPSHVVNAVAAPREVMTAVGTATKQQTKDTLNTFLSSGSLRPTNPIRLTTVEELHDIINTGTLRPGKDFEGRSGISAQLVDGKKPIVAYGPNDRISAAIVFPEDAVAGKGMAPNEVKVSQQTPVENLRFVVDGFRELMSFGELKEAVGEKQQSVANSKALEDLTEEEIAALPEVHVDHPVVAALKETKRKTKGEQRDSQPRETAQVAAVTAFDSAAHEAATSPHNNIPEPTQAQIEAGNYKKGHVDFQGLDISIENPAGSTRKGVDPNGKAWETTLAHHYGYIKGTVGRDKDHIDVFIGPDHHSDKVFIVGQVDPASRKFDEHKVMLGFDSRVAARAGYLANYDQSGKDRIGTLTEVSIAEFKQWLSDGDTKRAFAPARNKARFEATRRRVLAKKIQEAREPAERERLRKILDKLKNVPSDANTGVQQSVGNDRVTAMKPPRAAWNGFPDVLIHAPESAVKKHPLYQAAKSGDADAAVQLVDDTMSAEQVESLRTLLDDRKPVLLSVHAYEETGVNAIPEAFADKLGNALGLAVDDRIVQTNVVGHTGANGYSRMARQAYFDGEVTPNVEYVLVDDFIGQGGTLANLKGYIESKGGRVIAAVALTGKPFSAKLTPDSTQLQELRQKHGDLETWWQTRFGHSFDRLTQSEARYLARSQDADTIRDRIAAAEQEGNRGKDQVGSIDDTPRQSAGDVRQSPTQNHPDSPRTSPPPTNGPSATEKSTTSTTKPSTAPPKVTDSGEELVYNKRNRIRSGISWNDVAGKNDALKAKEVQKGNVYPKPDYEAMVNDGMRPEIAHVVKQVYDALAAKPAVRGVPADADFQLYIAAVKRVMDGVVAWSNDRAAIRSFVERNARVAGAMLGKRTALSDLAPGRSLLDIVYPDGWREYKDEIRILGGNKALGALQPGTDELVRALKDIEKGWPGKIESWRRQGWRIVGRNDFSLHDVPQPGDRPTIYVIRLGREHIMSADTREKAQAYLDGLKQFVLLDKRRTVKGSFETEEQARETAREAVKKAGGGTRIEERGTNVADAERTGPAHRMEGEDVDSDRLRAAFGFRGVNFGNWVPQDERQLHLNHAYDSFMDLAEILDVPPRALSLNGMLGLAIGAQGAGQVAAHFVPGVNEINITRTAGAGSLTHEWAHALDHYFATMAGYGAAPAPWLSVLGKNKEGGEVRPEVLKAFSAIVTAMERKKQTPQEAAESARQKREQAHKRLEKWLDYIGAQFKGNETAAEAYAALADRIRRGEYQHGEEAYVQIAPARTRGGGTAVLSVVSDVRDLAKKSGVRISLDDIRSLHQAVTFPKYLDDKQQGEHEPQPVMTAYKQAALALDKGRKKAYWSSRPELFARAFDAYVTDKLEAKAQANSYLSHAGRKGPTVPNGEERTVIDTAFDTLIDTLETRETEQGVALLSRAAGTVRVDAPLSVEDAGDVIRDFLKLGKFGGRVTLKLADSFDSLPDKVRTAAEDAGGTKDNTYAVLHNDGSVWLIRDAHATREQMETSIFHEVYGHLGIFRLFGVKSIQSLNRLFNRLGGYDGLAAIADKHGVRDLFDAYWRDAQSESVKGMQHARITAELLALIGQKSPSLMRKAQEVWGGIRQALRRIGLMKLARYNDSDLAYLLAQGRKALRTAGKGGEFTVLMTANFSAARDSAFSTPAATIKAALKSALQASRIPIRVIQSLSDLPTHIQADMRLYGIEAIDGVFDPRTNSMYLVADFIPSVERARELLRHEWFHAGVADKELEALYRYYSQKDMARLQRIADERGFDLSSRYGRLEAAGELAAQLAESNPKNLLLARIVARIKEWLRALGLQVEFGQAEVAGIIRDAIQRVQAGPERMQGARALAGSAYSAAWHGTPHQFDKFSMDKVGTGEGAQAYGHGLYFAGNREVAEYYRKSVPAARTSFSELSSMLKDANPEVYSLIEQAVGKDKFYGSGPIAVGNIISKTLSGSSAASDLLIREHGLKGYFNIKNAVDKLLTGRLYQVELAPQEDEYLLWDKPLEEQPEKAKQAILKWAEESKQESIADLEHQEQMWPGQGAAKEIERIKTMFPEEYIDELVAEGFTGEDLYHDLTATLGSDNAASEYLHTLGIRGIKYLDGSSRSAGEGNFNYVIFDDKDVDIRAQYSTAKQDADIAAHAARIDAPSKVADMTKGLFELIGMQTPSRVKAAFGKVLSNPWWGSVGKPIRRMVVDLNRTRSHVRNEIISDLFLASEGYTGVEGLRNLLAKATKAERKLFNELIKYGDRNDVARNFTRDELYRGKTPFGKLSRTVVEAYKAFHQVIQAANRVRFERLSDIALVPYAKEPWYQELLDLLDARMHLDKDLSPTEVGQLGKLLSSTRRRMGDVELFGDNNPTGKPVTEKVAKAYRAFMDQLAATSEPGLVRMAYKHITEYRGELDKLKNEWGHVQGYAPRMRKDGDWHVSVYRVDEESNRTKVYMKPATTEGSAKRHVAEVQADLAAHLKGNYDAEARYEVAYERNTATPAELLSDRGSELAIEQLIMNAFDKANVFKTSAEDLVSMKRAILDEVGKQIMAQGFGRHGISREKTQIEGYRDDDYLAVLQEFISGMAGWLSKMQYAVEVNREADRISTSDPDDKVWVHNYFKDSMKNSTSMDEVMATARSVGAFYYLGFKFSSAVLNAFQNYTLGQALLAGRMKKAGLKGEPIVILAKAQKDVVKDAIARKHGGTGVLTDEERGVIDQAVRQGTARAQAVRFMSGLNEQGFGGRWKKVVEVGMTPFSAIEQYVNREPAVLAAYRVFKTTPRGQFDQKAFDIAVEFVDDAHVLSGKENLPEMVRKVDEIFPSLGKTLYLFQGYTHNYLLAMANALKNGEFEVIARSLGAVAALGGVFALPGADDLDKWITKWFGVSYKLKFKMWMKRHAREYGTPGEALEAFVNHGATSVAGVDMSRALAVNLPFVSDPDKSFGERMGGVWGGMVKKPVMAAQALGSGQYFRAIESMMPEFAANPMRAYRQATAGATTLSGKPILDETGHQMRYSGTDVAKKVLGFQPMGVAERTELKSAGRGLVAAWSDERTDYLNALRVARTPEQVRQAIQEAIRWNYRLHRSQAKGLVRPISAESIRRARTFRVGAGDKRRMGWEQEYVD